MKKFLLLSVAVASMGFISNAQITTPLFYSENFVEMTRHNDYVTDGWITYGVDAKPVQLIAETFFPDDDEDKNAFALLSYGEYAIPVCSTEFTPSTKADQWLISPEIEISSDNVELVFSGCAYGAKGAFGIGENTFKVYISTTGVEKEDFYDNLLLSDKVNSSMSQEIVMKDFAVPVNGFAGKKIHLAFVADGQDVGMTGFTNIKLGDYYMDITNYTQNTGEIGGKYQFRVNIKGKTPKPCPGLNTILYINDEKVKEEYFRKEFGSNTTSLVTQLVTFKDIFEIKDDQPLTYRFEITPDYEGAFTSTVVGSVGVPKLKYIKNVVVEEVTASGCGWCPVGMASMEYYQDNYKGSETEGKFIGIAVHGYINWYDPMSEGTADYLTNIMSLNGTTSYPQAMFNRATRGMTPEKKSEFEKLIATTSNNKVDIKSVEYPVLEEGETAIGKQIKVKFNARNSFSAEGLGVSSAVVMIENNVKGFNSGFNQENYLSTKDAAFIKSQYGEFLVPYMTDYIVGGSKASDPVPFEKMEYNHVARGIWPGFFGEGMSTSWEADVPQEYEMTFTVPETISDFDNTEVIILMLDNRTYEILAADNCPAANYTAVSSVSEVADSNIVIEKSANNIYVNASNGAKVLVVAIDGTVLANETVIGDCMTVNASAWDGPVIIKVTDGNKSAVKKLIF